MAPLLLEEIKKKRLDTKFVTRVELNDFLHTERLLALALVVVVGLFVRARDPLYSTAYMDESIYVIYGRMFLAQSFESPLSTPLQWSFGWYLWPMMSAAADWLAGLAGVRLLAAGLGTVAVISVYSFTKRAISVPVALAAAAMFAVLPSAVLASRIATRDAGAFPFFAMALCAYAWAWHTGSKRGWLASGCLFFAAFLCKYVVAIYFPFLALLALFRKGWRSFGLFTLPLAAACAAYLAVYWRELRLLLSYGGGYNSLRASGHDFWTVYFRERIDFWIVALLAIVALFFARHRRTALLLWGGAAIGIAFQVITRADYDWWKHANYVLIFLVPVAALAVLEIARVATRARQSHLAVVGSSAVIVLVIVLAAAGKAVYTHDFLFWPNVEPALAALRGQVKPGTRLLVDDSVFRYYYMRELHQSSIADPFYFEYKGAKGASAYAAAVRDEQFDYIILNGGMGREAQEMDAAIRPELANYRSLMWTVDPTLGRTVEVYARSSMPNPTKSALEISSPADGEISPTRIVNVSGRALIGDAGWSAEAEVFTDRWYPQGRKNLRSDRGFVLPTILGGEGLQQCNHLIAVTLYDSTGARKGTSLLWRISRANVDGSRPACAPAPVAPPPQL
ncbi:MAG TPA: glycosyltransferase family 39 protein [Clostridia bacterium]|nr:glycosyltransferase family 39 protein [Clostridia bacterium]